MGHKQDRIVTLEKQVRELTALRAADNQKFSAKLAQERKLYIEAIQGYLKISAMLQGALDSLKGIVPLSSEQGLKDCDAGKMVAMEKPLSEQPGITIRRHKLDGTVVESVAMERACVHYRPSL